jgi:hypothetical protein
MFDQPPLTAKEVFGRGFVQGSAVLFFTFLLSLTAMLPSRYGLYVGGPVSLWETLVFYWPVLSTVGCVLLLFGKERTSLYRSGVLTSLALFLAVIAATWINTR